MSTLSEITQLDKVALEKIGLEAHFHCDPNQKENLLFLSPLLLLEDYDLKEGGYKDYGAKNILGRVTKDILQPDGDALLQVPEITNLHMGYGKKSENKKGKMAITEEEAKHWKSFINLSRFTRSPNTDAEPAASGDNEEETPMEVAFPTPQDIQAHEFQQENSIEMVPPEMSGLKIPLKGRYILLFSILLIFFDKKKKKERGERSDKEEAKIGANKISDFMLFWILPYLLSFNNRKVGEIIQHHKRARCDEFNDFVEISTLHIINDLFDACGVPAELLKGKIIDKYKDYYGTEQLQCKYKLLKTVDNTPLILVPKRYIIKQMPATLDDIGQNWRKLGNVTLLDEFMNKFVRSREIQEDFLYSMKDLKGRQGIDYAILLPDEKTFEEVVDKLEKESADYLSRPTQQLGRRGRFLISPRIGLVKNTDKDLTVCISFVQGKRSRHVSALFRAIGAHYYDHFTLVILHGLSLYRGADPQYRVGNLYPVASARRMLFKGRVTDKQVKKEGETDFSEAQGRFSKAEFPETFAMWEQTVISDPTVKKVIEQTQNNLKVKPTFKRCANLTVGYSTSSNAHKLQCISFGAALAQNERKLEGYKVRAVNLDGCLLSRLAKCGREGNTAVVLAIKDVHGKHGSCLSLDLPAAIKMIVTHFVRAVVVAGLPKVYPPESDDENRDENQIACSSSEEEEEEDQEYSGPEAGMSSGPSGVQATRPRGQIKQGVPQDEVLETLSREIGEAWKPLGRRLKFGEAALKGFHKDNEEYSEKAYQMLLFWKQREGSAATYQVLNDALCHDLVEKTSLAEKFCYESN